MPKTSLKERNERSLDGDDFVIQTPDGPLYIHGQKTQDTGEIFIRLPRGYAGIPHQQAKAIYEIFKELIDQ